MVLYGKCESGYLCGKMVGSPILLPRNLHLKTFGDKALAYHIFQVERLGTAKSSAYVVPLKRSVGNRLTDGTIMQNRKLPKPCKDATEIKTPHAFAVFSNNKQN